MEVLEDWGEFIVPGNGFSWLNSWQLIPIVLILAAAVYVRRRLPEQEAIKHYSPWLWLRWNISALIFWFSVGAIHNLVKYGFNFELTFFRFFSHLTTAWIVIGILASLIRSKFWVESVLFVAYAFTGLFALALADDSVKALESLRFTIGSVSISAWGVFAGAIAFATMLWLSLALAKVAEDQIKRLPRLSPSLKVLLTKIIRVALIVITVAVALSSMGLDLSALTIFGGALGLGLGFGLQKVISNFVSGIILLLDNSVKPGDVIEIDGTYGWINNLRGRYASVITRDGTEHLIPNEDLITQHVINWSFTDNLVRVRIPIGVSYNANPHECIALALEAAHSIDRVLKSPAPNCLLRGFGESSLDLELRIWIADPSNGVGNVKSRVLLAIWDIFKEHNIEIPFPQRDLHIRSNETTLVTKTNPDPEEIQAPKSNDSTSQ